MVRDAGTVKDAGTMTYAGTVKNAGTVKDTDSWLFCQVTSLISKSDTKIGYRSIYDMCMGKEKGIEARGRESDLALLVCCGPVL